MKRFFIWMLAIALPLIFTSCDKNSPSQADEGTETIVELGASGMRIYTNYSTLYLFEIYKDYMCKVGVSDGYFEYGDLKFVDFGKVNKLSQVDYIPTNGWVDNMINISVGHGYIVRPADIQGFYMRIYFKEFIDKGEVQGYRIVYQQDWDPLRD